MTLHKDPKYQAPELIVALKQHGFPCDTPNQLADAFRCGWVARQSEPNGTELTYHLRQYGNATKEQIDNYIGTGDINTSSNKLNNSKDPLLGYSHWENRIKDLMKQTASPDSLSVFQAMKQLCNEMMQDSQEKMLINHASDERQSAFETAKVLHQTRDVCLYKKFPRRMKINSPAGTAVIFDGECVDELEKNDALSILEVGKQYVIEYIVKSDSTIHIKLVGYVHLFNSVMFADLITL